MRRIAARYCISLPKNVYHIKYPAVLSKMQSYNDVLSNILFMKTSITTRHYSIMKLILKLSWKHFQN